MEHGSRRGSRGGTINEDRGDDRRGERGGVEKRGSNEINWVTKK